MSKGKGNKFQDSRMAYFCQSSELSHDCIHYSSKLLHQKMTTQTHFFTRILACCCLLFGTCAGVQAQVKYGFKTGLNFAKMNGTAETNAAGESLETWNNSTGFHIGMTFGYAFTDNFGLRGEFLYSKRGAKYTFDGPSYRVFKHSSGSVLTLGNSQYLISINNSYMDLPLMVYGRYGRFELSGGGYVGVLVQSGGEGTLRYSGKTLLGNDIFVNPNTSETELNFNLNHNYRKDDPGEGSSGSNDEVPVTVKVDAFISETPKTLGAYYDHPAGKGRLYNSLDYGLVGGLSIFISNALYFHVRAQYGLADITNNNNDLSKGSAPASIKPEDLKYRDDKDRNFVIQASVGFSF